MNPKIDSDWFESRIIKKHGSLKAIAPKMTNRLGKPMNVSAVYQLLQGSQRISDHEIRQFAKLLSEPYYEVRIRAGIVTRAEHHKEHAKLVAYEIENNLYPQP